MARRSGLGRGLGALIPPQTTGGASGSSTRSSLEEVPLSRIRPNQYQPRRQFDEESLSSLVDSIRAVGVLQPVLLRSIEDGDFELIAGERRCRAARRAGLQSIPALIQDVSDASSLEQALVENLHREDLNPLDEAAAYQQLIEDFDLTHDEVSRRVGKSRAAITNTLRLFQLPPSVQRLVQDRRLSPGHARALLGTPDRELQEALAERVVADGLSVRAIEEVVRAAALEEVAEDEEGTNADPSLVERSALSAPSRLRPPGVLELEELLALHLNTRVRVDMGARRGKVTVEFATLEDLERIYKRMIGESENGL